MFKIFRFTSKRLDKLGSLAMIAFITTFFISVVSCAKVDIDPDTLAINELDKETSEFPPEKEELINKPRLMLNFVVFKDGTVTDDRLAEITRFINQGFIKNGNFEVVGNDKISQLLEQDEFAGFQASNIADAIRLGQKLEASFISQMQISILAAEVVKGTDQFQANINQTIFTTDSGQVVFKQNLNYNSQKTDKSIKVLKELVQTHFPLRGFILETKGNRQIAKISMGSEMGIKLDREFLVRKREVKTEMVAGITRKLISYSPLAAGTVKVYRLSADAAWVVIDEKLKSNIKKGMTVFSLPEKSGLF